MSHLNLTILWGCRVKKVSKKTTERHQKGLLGRLLYCIIKLQHKLSRKQVHYTMFGIRNQVVLPLNLEININLDDPVFKLIEICDELDYTAVSRLSSPLAKN